MVTREDALRCRQYLYDAIDALKTPGDAVNENYVMHCLDKARECMNDIPSRGINARWAYDYDTFGVRD